MASNLLILQLAVFGFTLWLGCYLIARNPKQPLLLLSGLGLISYAIALALNLLQVYASSPGVASGLNWFFNVAVLLPALCWIGTVIYLLPPEDTWHSRLKRFWLWGLVPLALLSNITIIAANWQNNTFIYAIFGAVMISALIASLFFVRYAFQSGRPAKIKRLIFLVTLFFTLGVGLLLFPFNWLPRLWVLLLIGLDLEILGFSIAALDAFDEGETFLPDFLRSLNFSLFSVLLFAGLVVVTIIWGTGINFSLLALLTATISAAIIWQTFSSPIESLLDRLALANFLPLRQSRQRLRDNAGALSRLDSGFNPAETDEEEFARLTRRALSHFGDLPRLASNPLTQLPLVSQRLQAQETHGDTLARAAELKQLLTESILQLKPLNQGDFGASDEWRYYNALYFPYVVGLKPYSRRAIHTALDPASQQALEWFQINVPTRTLYNWQNAAARLVAQNLREQSAKLK